MCLDKKAFFTINQATKKKLIVLCFFLPLSFSSTLQICLQNKWQMNFCSDWYLLILRVTRFLSLRRVLFTKCFKLKKKTRRQQHQPICNFFTVFFLLNFTIISIDIIVWIVLGFVCIKQKKQCAIFTDSAVILTLSLRCSNSTKWIERTPTDRPMYFVRRVTLFYSKTSSPFPTIHLIHSFVHTFVAFHSHTLPSSRFLSSICLFFYGFDVRVEMYLCTDVCMYTYECVEDSIRSHCIQC